MKGDVVIVQVRDALGSNLRYLDVGNEKSGQIV